MPDNKFATEPQVRVMDNDYFIDAENLNGRLAMIGFVAALGSYLTTGQLIPGIFQNMPKGKGTYGTKKGRPPKKGK